MFSILHAAGARGLDLEQWNEQARAVGIGTKRPATLLDLRMALKAKVSLPKPCTAGQSNNEL